MLALFLLVVQGAVVSQAQTGLSRDPCVNFQCQNGGNCTAPADAPYCLCPPPYTGVYCEEIIRTRDPCVNVQCQNGGTCEAPADAPYCHCPLGYSGQYCEERIYSRNPCLYFTCDNGGTCTSPYDAPFCICPHGYGGDRCETEVKPGKCPDNDDSSEMGLCVMACENDYNCTGTEKCCSTPCGGKVCTDEIITDSCGGYCFNGGTCSAPADAPICECQEGFYGERCETDGSLEHPGLCPTSESKGFGVRGGEFCTSDNNCTIEQKCCRSDCGGYLCTKAEDSLPQTLTCASVLCDRGRFCRPVVPCTTCQPEPRCIPSKDIGEGIDDECKRQNYSQVILMEEATNSSMYNQLKCGGPLDSQTCPSESVCVDDMRGGGTCCRGKMGGVTPVDKPGSCPPSGEFSICGGIMCKYDNDCPGDQKCCPGCGNMCADPVVEELCGNEKCSSGQTCVQKQRPCAPGRMCIQSLIPTCVPDECIKCEYNEDCNKTPSGYECIPFQQLDQCGGCPSNETCIDTGIRCFTAPCPTFQCVPKDECGGCPSDQICIDTGIRCIKAPCPTFQCVPKNECGGCPSDQICIDTGIRCIKAPCPTFQCMPKDECGGCPSDQICKDSGIRCKKAPCPTFQCVPKDECGGCSSGQVCKDTGVRCKTSPCPSFQCVAEGDPNCSLRCKAGYTCEFQQPKCLLSYFFRSCVSTPVATCVRFKPNLGSCPQVALQPRSIICLIRGLLSKCTSDRDCPGYNQRCCSSACGDTRCTAVKGRILGEQ